MKVYPLLYAQVSKDGIVLIIVAEVFSSAEYAMEYAFSLAEGWMERPPHDIIERPVRYEAPRNTGLITMYGESGQKVSELAVWAETVRPDGWHA